jgi:hypothetical protein
MPDFRFRLNNVVIPEIRIQRAPVNGEPVGEVQIAVRDEWIGWFAIDDNSHLPQRHYTQFVLEYRNDTEWSKVDPILRRSDPTHGWRRVSPRKLMKVLQNAGVIDVPELRD